MDRRVCDGRPEAILLQSLRQRQDGSQTLGVQIELQEFEKRHVRRHEKDHRPVVRVRLRTRGTSCDRDQEKDQTTKIDAEGDR